MTSRRRRPRSWVERGRDAIVPGLLAVAAYYAVFGGEYSVFEVRRARGLVEVEREALAEVSAEIDSLSAWADSLENDPVTIERIARERFGMIRDGETLYRFVPESESAERVPEPTR